MAWLERRGKKWLVVWREDGVRHSKSKPTRDEARILKAEVEKQLLQGTLAHADQRKQTFGVYARNLFESDLGIRDRTRENRIANIRLHLDPRLGKYTMEELQPARVRAALADIHREQGAWTTEACLRTLSRVFRQAMLDGIIHRNPLEGYRPPKTQKRPTRILTPEEVGSIADAINPRFRALVLLSAWGGLRIGELGGLQRGDIDFSANTVAIRRAVSTPASGPELGPPKTASSARVVTLPGWVMRELREHLLEYPGVQVFTLPQTGGFVTHTSLSWYWQQALRRSGLEGPLPRFHDLRHTAVSILIRQGAHPKLIQARMGHSSITQTMDVYGHLFPSADAQLAATLEEFEPPGLTAVGHLPSLRVEA